MPLKLVAAVIALAGVGILLYAFWFNRQPRTVISTGSVLTNSRTGGRTASARTRVIEQAGRQFSEVELPNGTWIDCAGDCAEALRKAHLDFWDEQKKP